MGIHKKEKGTSMTLQFKKATHLEKTLFFISTPQSLFMKKFSFNSAPI